MCVEVLCNDYVLVLFCFVLVDIQRLMFVIVKWMKEVTSTLHLNYQLGKQGEH